MVAQPAPFVLRLTEGADDDPPAGLVVGRRSAAPMLIKLHERLTHYVSLRLLATELFVVILSPERKPLPWVPDIRFFLRRTGMALVPSGMKLDVPARWHDDIVARLAADKRQAPPLLILPHEGGLLTTGLADARSVLDVDLVRLAAELAS